MNKELLRNKLKSYLFVSPVITQYLNDDKINNLIDFLDLLIKWNKVYNLTNITDHEEILIKHFLDSLLLADYIQEVDSIADIGTGAGFPGVPLAILFPHKKFDLVDTLGKRISFLNFVKSNLKLNNINPIKSRVEDLQKTYQLVICRAFAPINKIFQLADHLVIEGKFMFMKARLENEQLEYKNYQLINSFDLSVNFDSYLNKILGKRILLEYKKIR